MLRLIAPQSNQPKPVTDNLTRPPDALLLIAPGCAHCPVVLQNLSELVKTGEIGRLEVVNVAAHPEVAEQHKVRSVPWLRLGSFELQGVRSRAELQDWIARRQSPEGAAAYLQELLTQGELDTARRFLKAEPTARDGVMLLLTDADTELNVRIGIAAIFEHLAGEPVLQGLVAPLGRLSEHDNARLRADACHLLGLTGNKDAIAFLQTRLNDDDTDVREVAEESLALLQNAASD